MWRALRGGYRTWSLRLWWVFVPLFPGRCVGFWGFANILGSRFRMGPRRCSSGRRSCELVRGCWGSCRGECKGGVRPGHPLKETPRGRPGSDSEERDPVLIRQSLSVQRTLYMFLSEYCNFMTKSRSSRGTHSFTQIIDSSLKDNARFPPSD